jgi:hypothetical protein
MDKKILIGLISGIILGVLEMFLFKGGAELIAIPAILGAAIGFAQTQSLGINKYLLGIIAGAVFFVFIAMKSGLWLDDIATGAITGLVITLIIHFMNQKNA